MREIPKPNEIYRHFKGELYRIVTIAQHSETGEKMVVYQALYGDYKVYVRELSMFLSRVDKQKYPDAVQEDRFMLMSGIIGQETDAADKKERSSRAEVWGTKPLTDRQSESGQGAFLSSQSKADAQEAKKRQTSEIRVETKGRLQETRPEAEGQPQEIGMEAERRPQEIRPETGRSQEIKSEMERRSQETRPETERQPQEIEPKAERQPQETRPETEEAAGASDGEALNLDPALLGFLDADTYGEKLNFLAALHGRITDDMINTMSVSLDMEINDGNVEERYEALKNGLLMLKKYESSRLR